MQKQRKKILKSLLAITLIFGVMFSSFGFSIYLHKCNNTGLKGFSLITANECQHENIQLHSCCNDSKNCESNENKSIQSKNSITHKQEINNDCCTFDEESFSLSPVYLFDKSQKLILNSNFYSKFSQLISKSNFVDKIQSYYLEFQRKIVTPTKLLVKFILQLSSKNSDKEDSNS